MELNVLTASQIEQFIESGYVKLEEAFSRQQALLAQDFIWKRLAQQGVEKDDQATWTEPMIHLQESYDDPVFQACATEKLYKAVEDLVGKGRYAQVYGTPTKWGWWPVNFSVGANQPWDVPTRGWHWDGIHFRHFIDSPEQGLLLLCIFSDIETHSGGTLIAEGSHKLVTQFLKLHPDGIELNEAIKQCNTSHPWLAELTGKTDEHTEERVDFFMKKSYRDTNIELRVVDTTGKPGDIYLCHPFLYHSASQNHSGVPRFICNRTTPLKARMQLQRQDENYSPVELSIRQTMI